MVKIIQNYLQKGVDGILDEHKNLRNVMLGQEKTEGRNIFWKMKPIQKKNEIWQWKYFSEH